MIAVQGKKSKMLKDLQSIFKDGYELICICIQPHMVQATISQLRRGRRLKNIQSASLAGFGWLRVRAGLILPLTGLTLHSTAYLDRRLTSASLGLVISPQQCLPVSPEQPWIQRNVGGAYYQLTRYLGFGEICHGRSGSTSPQ